MVEADSELWERLLFRDYLKQFPAAAKQYDMLKRMLAKIFPNDRVTYTKEKSEFIVTVTIKAKMYYG